MTETTDIRWRCPGCGSDEIEGLGWVHLNDETVESWDENSEYWCPKCEEHVKYICEVNTQGFCLLHERPFDECRGEAGSAQPLSFLDGLGEAEGVRDG